MMRRRYLALACLVLCIDVCSCTTCSEPPPVANTYRTLTPYHVIYTCIDNHVHVSGDLTRECEDGEYGGTPPVCTLQCGPPLNNGGAILNYTGSDLGSEVGYKCPDGYLLDSTSSVCDGTVGKWTHPQYCFKNESKAPSIFEAVDLSTSTTLANGSIVHGTQSGDVTNLKTGGCVRTIGEQNQPNINVTLVDKYNLHTVVFTLGDFVSPLKTLQLKQLWSVGSRYSRSCRTVTTPLNPRDTLHVTCIDNDRAFIAILQIIADFGDRSDNFEICNLKIYARPKSTGDCGQPLEIMYAVKMNEPLTTTYVSSKESRVYYTCIEGFHIQSGRGYSYCTNNEQWSIPLVCTDKVNFAHDKRAWIPDGEYPAGHSSPELTDFNTSTCLETHETVTVDLGINVQVSDVTVVASDSTWRTLMVEVVGEDGSRTRCGSTRVYHMAHNMACSHHSTGRFLDIRQTDGKAHICEIFVHGREDNGTLECYRYNKGRGYRGKMNMTIDGTPCQNWSASTPHPHDFRDVSMFPDPSLSDLGNYCRNPNSRDRPWCFTTDPNKQWQYCPLHYCNYICKFDQKGTAYTGTIIRTTTGQICKQWTSPGLPFKQKNHRSGSLHDHNHCRNPLGSQTQPWCYLSEDGSQYGFCTIPFCPTTTDLRAVNWIINATFVTTKIDYCAVWLRNHLYDSKDTRYVVYRTWLNPVNVCPAGKTFNTTFICYKLEGTSTEWISGTIDCVNCGPPPSVSNTTAHYTTTFLDAVVTYTCLPGYNLASGSNTASCLRSGTWSLPDIVCLIDCSAPPLLEHATPILNSTLQGDEAVYTCVNGTKHVSGSNSITCLATGNWSTPDFICKVHCGSPPLVNNTSATESTELEGARVIYTCRKGFMHVSGSETSTCLSSGNWTEPQIYCEVDCGQPPAVNNAKVTAEKTVLNSTALYSCDSGFVHMTGSPLVMCKDTGLWEEPEILCSVDCGEPYKVEHTVISMNSSHMNSTCVYSCSDGYGHSSGSLVITCRSDGKWELPTFTCSVDCRTPPLLEHATPTLNSTLEGDEAVYTCVNGTKHVSGSNSVTCLATGNWSTPDFTCKEIVTTTVQPALNITDKYGRVRYGTCTCRCKVKLKPVEDAAQEITKELTLETKELTSFVQKKTSKPDERSSSKGMAVLAGVLMALVGGVIIIPDLLSVYKLLTS